MDDFAPLKGDDVRRGLKVYLDSISNATIEVLSNVPLSESLLYHLNDGNTPLTPISAKAVGQSYKEGGKLSFSLRLIENADLIGFCRFGDVGWQARHAQLHLSIVEEAYLTPEIVIDVLQTVLKLAYWEANLNRIAVHCIEDNTLLFEALKHTGFTNEGRLRDDVYRNGRYLDRFIFSILCREWENIIG
ncbi:MAG: GNAT family protein [Anaerolineae bacterium]